MSGARPSAAALLTAALLSAIPLASQDDGPPPIQIRVGAHRDVSLDRDVERVAIGDPEVAGVEVVDTRRLLILGRGVGVTTLTTWSADGAIAARTIEVRPDLRLLEDALARIDPDIRLEVAPDRFAVVLLGSVLDVAAREAAEAAALAYLEAGQRVEQPVVSTTGEVVEAAASRNSARVVNLLAVRELPPRIEARIAAAIAPLAGDGVVVRRIQRGTFPDDDADVLVLEGRVPDQVTLVRTLQLSARIYLGRNLQDDEVRVIADEAGALVTGQRNANVQNQQGGSNLSRSSTLLGANNQQALQALQNQVRNNLARASSIELAGGRILSFLEVEDLPQVRVAIRLYEVDRSALLNLRSELGLLNGDFDQGSLQPTPLADLLRGPGNSIRPGSVSDTDVQNAVGFLADTGFSEQLQLVGSRFALDWVFQALETAGVAKQLSSPNLTVLSGERAQFQVGGQIPLLQTFTPAFGEANGLGTFNSVEFREFGVQLAVRPLVGGDGAVTLDLSAQVAQPDQNLTLFVRDVSGTEPLTTAFSSRALQTSTRLGDGQALLVGGLVSNSTSRNENKVPVLGDLPLLGWLFRSRGYDATASELFIVLSPLVVRDPIPGANLWLQPTSDELLRAGLGRATAVHDTSRERAEKSVAPENRPGDSGIEGSDA